MKNLIPILLFAFFFSCKKENAQPQKPTLNSISTTAKNSTENKAIKATEKATTQTSTANTDCDFEEILSDAKTPILAKDLFYNKAKYSEEPLQYFKFLKSKDEKMRAFYFRVITNSYKIADGAYSEGLGFEGARFIDGNPQQFIGFFDNKNCFNDEDLKTWAKIAMLSYMLMDDGIDLEKDEPEVEKVCKKLKKESQSYTENQKQTIDKFCNFLSTEWKNYVKNIE